MDNKFEKYACLFCWKYPRCLMFIQKKTCIFLFRLSSLCIIICQWQILFHKKRQKQIKKQQPMKKGLPYNLHFCLCLKNRLRKLKTMWTSPNNSLRTIESREKALSTPQASFCFGISFFSTSVCNRPGVAG